MREKNKNYRGIPLYFGVCLLCVLVFCVLPVQADYWEGFSENGQYQVTFTPDANGGATIQGAAVGPGGSITPLSGGDSSDPGITQNLRLEGPSGWAEVIAQDGNDNEAHAEVEFTDGCVYVHQYAIDPEIGTMSGVEAGQCVWSHDFSTIEASSYSFNADGSTAGVSAEATSGDSQSEAFGYPWGCESSMFSVHQGTGAFSPVVDETDHAYIYSVDGGHYGPPTYAYQCGLIKNADTATVAAGSSIPQAFTSLVSGTVEDGNLNFCMGSTAGQSYCGNSYKTTADGNIEVRGNGTAGAISTAPNNQFANVITTFNRTYCTRNYIDLDLSASGKIYTDDGDYKIKVETEVDRPCGYSGGVTATNSVDTLGKSVTFTSRHHYGGGAGVSTNDEWAYVWPHSHGA